MIASEMKKSAINMGLHLLSKNCESDDFNGILIELALTRIH